MTLDEYKKLSRDERLELAVAEMLRVLVAAYGPEEAMRRMRAIEDGERAAG